MFSVLEMPILRLFPLFQLTRSWRKQAAIHQNSLDLEEIPESLQRDLGLLDGRDRRGRTEGGAFRAARLVYLPRGL